MSDVQKSTTVTIDVNSQSSNAFIVDTVEENHVLVYHPMAPSILVRIPKEQINTVQPNIKDSLERGIDFGNANAHHLDYNSKADLESLAIYFAVKRKLTPRQKQALAAICGTIAAAKFNDDIRAAMVFVTKNNMMLDDFNRMWYNNFKGLFTGQQVITSKKQTDAIFNIAGFVLAEIENPTANRRK